MYDLSASSGAFNENDNGVGQTLDRPNEWEIVIPLTVLSGSTIPFKQMSFDVFDGYVVYEQREFETREPKVPLETLGITFLGPRIERYSLEHSSSSQLDSPRTKFRSKPFFRITGFTHCKISSQGSENYGRGR